MTYILLAEDDFDFATILKQYLEISGFQVTWAKNGAEALAIFNSNSNFNGNNNNNSIDICILDVMMPQMDGFMLAEKIITINPEMPFLFLTAKSLKEDKIKGLKLGADDYILKPCEADELVLRLQNILKRSQSSNLKSTEIIPIGKYQFDYQNQQLIHLKKTQRLTEKESQLLLYLLQNKNGLIKREAILNTIWGNNDFFSGRSMDVFVSRLRKYFSEDSNIKIESIRGLGFEFKLC
ncbi:response regulator transcription factor [Flavobacterium sp. ZT3R18]|uniref:response regulator transcription factor n=1 Tax=Flavobacterium sp. ZT3R18 TaxID=2594429 RepID=UPI00117B2E93|nr:response regulator transcription factor [Flavobacterium sp. ZT3R18]TRX38587.1 response regulator transcription factor [Flavobacterium sp. ZT3R18]